MPALTSQHHRHLLRLAARPEGLLVADAAHVLGLSRATVGAHLRHLEQDRALLAASVIDGGRLRYVTTADGLIEADRHARLDAAR